MRMVTVSLYQQSISYVGSSIKPSVKTSVLLGIYSVFFNSFVCPFFNRSVYTLAFSYLSIAAQYPTRFKNSVFNSPHFLDVFAYRSPINI